MATVRELITKISFQYNGSGLQRAQNAVDKLLRNMRSLNRTQPRINVQANTSQAQLGLQRIRHQLQQMQSHTIRINTQGGPSGGGLGGGGNGLGSGFLGAMGIGRMSVAAMAGTALAASVTAAGAAAYSATMKFGEFDATMSKVKALTNASDKDMKTLTDTAMELGAKTKFSATQSAEAMTYLGMAGWKTKEIIAGMPGLLSLAAASGTDLATTADIVSDDLTAFGLKADQAGRMADVMAAASTNANTNVVMMGESFKFSAATAGTLGYSLEDAAIMTALMANAGIKGAMGGTALRTTMLRLLEPTESGTEVMQRLGITVKKADGTMKPLRQQIMELRSAFKKLSQAERTEAANSLVGQGALSGFMALINASEKDFNKMTNAIDNSKNSAKNMSDIMNDNLMGALTELGSATEGVAIRFGKKFEPAVKKAVQTAKKGLTEINEYMDRDESSKSSSPIEVNPAMGAAGGIAISAGIVGIGTAIASLGVDGIILNILGLLSKIPSILSSIMKWIKGFFIITLIASFIQYAFNHWEELKNSFNESSPKIQAALDKIRTAWELLQPAIQKLEPLIDSITELVGAILWRAVKLVWDIGVMCFNAIAEAINTAIWAVRTLIDWLDPLIQKLSIAYDWLARVFGFNAGANVQALDNMAQGWLNAKAGGNTQNINFNNPTFTVKDYSQAPKAAKGVLTNSQLEFGYGGAPAT